jgi:O-antigen/teichoic acid export membrane protein
MLGLAGGLVAVGLSGFVFVMAENGVFSSKVGPDVTSRATLTAYYFLVTTVLLGVFNALDQATDRRISHTIATEAPLRPAVMRAVRDAVGLAAGIAVLLLVASPVLVDRLLKGDVALFSAVLVGVVFAACESVVRGVLAGSRRFTAYGMVWGVEGVSRMLLVGVLLLTGEKSPWVFGYSYVIPYALAAVAGLIACRHLRDVVLGTEARAEARAQDEAAEGAKSMGLLSLSTAGLLATSVANLPQLVLTTRVPSSDVAGLLAASGFAVALLYARIVLTVLTPYQAMLLSQFTREVAVGNIPGLRRGLRNAVYVCGGVGVLWAVAVVAVEPTALRTFTSSVTPSLPVFAALSLGTLMFTVSIATQPAIVALGRYRQVPLIWGCGVLATVAGAFCPGVSAIDAAAIGSLTGPAVVLAGMMLLVRSGLAGSGAAADQDIPEMVIAQR